MLSFSFNHIAISVKDTDKSIEFYKKALGLEEIPNTASNSKTRWLSLGEGKQLHLIHRPDEEIKITKAVHFALATSEIDAFVERLKVMSINYSDWIGSLNNDYIRKNGIKQIYFQDIDGYWIEINNDVSQK